MSVSADRLILGTAQLGLSYGIANQNGKPDRSEAIALVHTALAAGVRVLDTARCYGDSEEVLRDALQAAPGPLAQQATVITKVNTPEPQEAAALSNAALADLARDGIRASCQALGVETLPVVLIREAWPLLRPNGFWQALLEMREQGLIGTLGLSAQAVGEADLAMACPDIGHLQIPFNLLDYRWRDGGALDRLASRPDITLHVRSVFLQGLLLGGDRVSWPDVANGCGPAVQAALLRAKDELGRASLADLCIAYVLGYPQVAGVVLGMETVAQLGDNLALLARPPLTVDQRKAVDAMVPRVPEALLNPGQW